MSKQSAFIDNFIKYHKRYIEKPSASKIFIRRIMPSSLLLKSISFECGLS